MCACVCVFVLLCIKYVCFFSGVCAIINQPGRFPPRRRSCFENSKNTPISIACMLVHTQMNVFKHSGYMRAQEHTHTRTLVKKRVPVDKSYSAGSLWKPVQIKCTYTCGNVLLMEPILTITSSAHGTQAAEKNTHIAFEGLTAGEGELNLLVDDLHGDEVVFFVESAVVEEQSVPLPAGKPAETEGILGRLLDLLYSLINISRNSSTN